jgi:hypothetical protein
MDEVLFHWIAACFRALFVVVNFYAMNPRVSLRTPIFRTQMEALMYCFLISRQVLNSLMYTHGVCFHCNYKLIEVLVQVNKLLELGDKSASSYRYLAIDKWASQLEHLQSFYVNRMIV